MTSGAPTKGFVPGLQQWARAREGPWEVARRRGRRKVTTPILCCCYSYDKKYV